MLQLHIVLRMARYKLHSHLHHYHNNHLHKGYNHLQSNQYHMYYKGFLPSQNYKDNQEDEGVLFHAESRVTVDPRPRYLP